MEVESGVESALEITLKSDVPFGQQRIAWVNKGQIFSFFFGIYIAPHLGELPLPRERSGADSLITDFSYSN